MFKLIEKIFLAFCVVRTKFVLGKLGRHSKIIWPGILENGKFMSMGDYSFVMRDSRIQILKYFKDIDPQLIIGNNSHINRFCHIVATHKMVIGHNVGISDSVMIVDATHEYEDVSQSYLFQSLKFLGEVEIGDETWVGRCVSIQGCKIGKHCVIGANSFVNKDIPDYCVVVGNPCRVVKRYNTETKCWEKTDKDGNFLTGV